VLVTPRSTLRPGSSSLAGRSPLRPGEDLKAADQGGLHHAVAAHLLDLEGVAAEADQSPALAVVVPFLLVKAGKQEVIECAQVAAAAELLDGDHAGADPAQQPTSGVVDRRRWLGDDVEVLCGEVGGQEAPPRC
jgi:hypothetical protein